jgi:hypothetical protein
MLMVAGLLIRKKEKRKKMINKKAGDYSLAFF